MVTVVAVTCCINLSRSLNHTTYMEVLVSEPSFSRAEQQQTTFVWMFLYFPYVCVYVVFMCVCLYLGACTRAGMCVWRPPWLSTLYTKVKSFNESQSCCLRESCCLLGSLLLSPTVCDERGASHPAGLCMGSGMQRVLMLALRALYVCSHLHDIGSWLLKRRFILPSCKNG